MAEKTDEQFNRTLEICKDIFLKKSMDYGTAWRVLRPVSVTDQIMIKALRIRHIQETGSQKIADKTAEEFQGIINYGIIALMQEQLPSDDHWDLDIQDVEQLYDKVVEEVRSLMQNKNHDYGEAWRLMSLESLVDLILSKLQRIRQILKNKGKTLVSEGIGSNVMDIINYGVFALILEGEKNN